MLIDINGDGYLDYFFGGSKKGDGNFNGTGFLGYVLNDKKGSFKICANSPSALYFAAVI